MTTTELLVDYPEFNDINIDKTSNKISLNDVLKIIMCTNISKTHKILNKLKFLYPDCLHSYTYKKINGQGNKQPLVGIDFLFNLIWKIPSSKSVDYKIKLVQYLVQITNSDHKLIKKVNSVYDTDYIYKQDYNGVIYEKHVQKILLNNELKLTILELQQAKEELKNIKEQIHNTTTPNKQSICKNVVNMIKQTPPNPLLELITYFYIELENIMKMLEKEHKALKETTDNKNKHYIYAKAEVEINKSTTITYNSVKDRIDVIIGDLYNNIKQNIREDYKLINKNTSKLYNKLYNSTKYAIRRMQEKNRDQERNKKSQMKYKNVTSPYVVCNPKDVEIISTSKKHDNLYKTQMFTYYNHSVSSCDSDVSSINTLSDESDAEYIEAVGSNYSNLIEKKTHLDLDKLYNEHIRKTTLII